MKDGLYIGIIFFLIAALAVLGFKKCNTTQVKTNVVISDTSTYEKRHKNTEYEKIETGAFNVIVRLNGELERLRDSVKNIKPKFIPFKARIINADTILSNCDEQMQLCSDYIDFQDQIIIKKDSVIGQYVLRLDNCTENLKFNQEFNNNAGKDKLDLIREINSYKHIIFRLYRKKK